MPSPIAPTHSKGKETVLSANNGNRETQPKTYKLSLKAFLSFPVSFFPQRPRCTYMRAMIMMLTFFFSSNLIVPTV